MQTILGDVASNFMLKVNTGAYDPAAVGLGVNVAQQSQMESKHTEKSKDYEVGFWNDKRPQNSNCIYSRGGYFRTPEGVIHLIFELHTTQHCIVCS